MLALIDIVLPVFLVVGAGYFVAWRKWFSESAVDGLMSFAQNFAIPALLFSAIANLDLSGFNLALLSSYYLGAFAVFFLGFFGARGLFARSMDDSVAIGFCALFPNSVLLGLAITERAYGTAALTSNYAIVAIHAPLLYAFGVMFMETARSRGAGNANPLATLGKIAKSLLSNPIIIGILLGFVVNLTALPLPVPLQEAVSMMARAGLPAALFGLGGVLFRYRPEGDMKTILFITLLSLMIHPAISYALASWVFALDQAQLRSVVLTAAMAPGVNTYLFANMYGAARRVAASSVLLATAISVLTIPIWLAILP